MRRRYQRPQRPQGQQGSQRPPPNAPPIQRKDGIKARSQRGQFGTNWWAQRWISALERVVNSGRLNRGRTYARAGQVLSLDEVGGVVKARVQGTRPQPYKVTIKLKPLSDRQWDRVIDALSGQALFAAQLLAGEMPQEIDAVFAAAGSSLFPSTEGELETECTCPDWANPCKHVAATHYILGEQFDEDPFLLFRLRGRSQEQIIAALRSRRAAAIQADVPEEAGTGASAALAERPPAYAADDPSPDEPLEAPSEEPLEEPLEASLAKPGASFWQLSGSLEHFPTAIHPPAAPLAVLRRLGQPGFVEQDLEQLLGPLYEEASRRALALAFHDDEPPTEGSVGEEEQ